MISEALVVLARVRLGSIRLDHAPARPHIPLTNIALEAPAARRASSWRDQDDGRAGPAGASRDVLT